VRILIVDDEPAIANTLDAVLTAKGYAADVAINAKEALAKANSKQFDLVLLDLGLPDADGKDIIQSLLHHGQIPILVVSARHQETEKVKALDAGAQDFINKPFGIDELLARIRVATRKSNAGGVKKERFVSEILDIDFETRKVVLMGDDVRLSPKEFDLLAALAQHPGQVITQRQLLIAGWNDPSVDGQYLRTYIGLLRQKLEADPSEPSLIVTEPGVGYRLAISVKST
jgi:two-component system KDP operon response regulator KdpE